VLEEMNPDGSAFREELDRRKEVGRRAVDSRGAEAHRRHVGGRPDLVSVDCDGVIRIRGVVCGAPQSNGAAEALEEALSGWRLDLLEMIIVRAYRVRARREVTGRREHTLRRLEILAIGDEPAALDRDPA